MKLKIETEIEINDPEGREWETVRLGQCRNKEFYVSGKGEIKQAEWDWNNSHDNLPVIIIRPLEPALELETDRFVARDGTNKISLSKVESIICGGELLVRVMEVSMRPEEARDLAKILKYWAENNRLPTRVRVKA